MNQPKYKSIISIFLIFIMFSASAFANKDDDKHESALSITQVTVDLSNNEIYIYGNNLEGNYSDPIVALSGADLVVSSASDSMIVAYLNPGTLDGDYLLTVITGMGETKRGSYDLTIGAVGPQGPQGDVGPQGPKGDTGAQGPKGDKGDTGAQGPRGFTGARGPKGDKGDTGARGPKGDKGDTGAQGPAGTLNKYTRQITFKSTSGVPWLTTRSGTVYCYDKNDIAVGGSLTSVTTGGYSVNSNSTSQSPNSTSNHSGSYICNQVFGCGGIEFRVKVECLSVP